MRKQAQKTPKTVDHNRRSFLQWALCTTAALGFGTGAHTYFSNFSLEGVEVDVQAWRARPGALLPIQVSVHPSRSPDHLSAHLVEVDEQGRVVRTLTSATHRVRLPAQRHVETQLQAPRLNASTARESYLLAVVVCDAHGNATLSNSVEVIASVLRPGA